MIRLPALVLAAVCLALSGPSSAFAMKEWTIIGYFVGDDDSEHPIEDSQIRDLLELASIPDSESVDLIVQMDRGKKLTAQMKQYYSDVNYSGGVRYQIRKNKWIQEAKIGEVNSGDPQTLYD